MVPVPSLPTKNLPFHLLTSYLPPMFSLGQRHTLTVNRLAPPGAYLAWNDLTEVLLPRRYVPADAIPGARVDVFVYLDSEDRIVATTETPFAMVGEFATLQVVSVNPNVGAFLAWGLPKDLLLPFREQTAPVRVGDRVVVFIQVDEKTNRLVASMRLNRHLNRTPPPFVAGQSVPLLITGKTPLGYNAIVAGTHLGLLYHDNLATPLTAGQKLNGFVRAIRDGGKLDLSLDAAGYNRVTPLTGQILEALERNHGALPLDDDSSPDAIRQAFGVSKKAFKQALGALYKKRRLQFTNPGIQLLDNTTAHPK